MIDISNQIDEILENFYRILCFYLKKRKKMWNIWIEFWNISDPHLIYPT